MIAHSHDVLWASPSPLWGRFLAGTSPGFRTPDQARPAILRFASDDFMEQLIAMLEAEPRRLGEVIARPETWRNLAAATPDLVARTRLPRMVRALTRARAAVGSISPVDNTAHEAQAEENGVTRTLPLKLYHPAHQRYYLVAANLVCGIPGFPDRTLATGGSEQVGFVLRRMLKPDANSAATEYAFVKESQGARWQRVASQSGGSTAHLVDGEELLPLFQLHFADDAQYPRRLFAGMVPVGRRDEYMTTGKHDPPAGTASGGSGVVGSITDISTIISERKEQFKLEVSEPWKNLIRSAHRALAALKEDAGDSPTPAQRAKAALQANERLQGQTWLVLLDFADYLAQHVPAVWAAVQDASKKPASGTPARVLYDWLAASDPVLPTGGTFQLSGAYAPTLLDALKAARSARNALEQTVTSYPDAAKTDANGALSWPAHVYLLAGVLKDNTTYSVVGKHTSLGNAAFNAYVPPTQEDSDPVAPSGATSPSMADTLKLIEAEALLLDRLVQLVVAAIDRNGPHRPAPQLPFAVTLRNAITSTNGDEGWFVLRCVYQRCDCGPLHPPVLSSASQRFQLASFFDPDAPARPIRIGLPLDTTPAGLRKFNKNTALLMSDVLCGQVQRAKGLGLIDLIRAVLPWPLHKDLDVGGVGTCKNGNGVSIGMICSLSIPIITICALILLMIIVSLLDLIFRWIPFFIMCFPVPGLKAKKPA